MVRKIYYKISLINVLVSKLTHMVYDLQYNIIHSVEEEIRRKEELLEKILDNISTLENVKKIYLENLETSKPSVMNIKKENFQMKHLNERLSLESIHMMKEQILIREEIRDMKKEIFLRDTETTQKNSEIPKLQAEIEFYKCEILRIGKRNSEISEIKKNIRTNIVLFKKENDIIKEKVAREEQKNKRFLAGISMMIERNKII